jgi:hypothetical protein
MRPSRTPIIAATVIVAVAGFAAPADAANNCQEKYLACQQRCAKRYEDFTACIYRTCNPQYDNCMSSSSETGGKRVLSSGTASGGVLALPPAPKPKIGHGVFSPVRGGLLDSTGGVSGQGPAATGSPLAPRAPSAPPVIIR